MSRRPRAAKGSERELQGLLLDYLTARGAFVWPDRQAASRSARYTNPRSRGVADILGIWRGKPLAVEVKKPKAKPPTKQQENFLMKFRAHGGIGIVARSVEDVAFTLARELAIQLGAKPNGNRTNL